MIKNAILLIDKLVKVKNAISLINLRLYSEGLMDKLSHSFNCCRFRHEYMEAWCYGYVVVLLWSVCRAAAVCRMGQVTLNYELSELLDELYTIKLRHTVVYQQ